MAYDPNTTQRQIVEASLALVDDMVADLDAQIANAKAALLQPIDYLTAQMVTQQISAVQGNRAVVSSEQSRLSGIIAAWNAAAS